MKNIRVVLLAGANSIHTIRWANGLQKAGMKVFLISQHPLMHKLDSEIKYFEFPYRGVFGYFLMVLKVRKILKDIKPDIINAHYASGYGTTARLVDFHPYVLSVWGSDIFLFPKKSFIHKWLVKKNLLAADSIASTSTCMANETAKLVNLKKPIAITPFGVDKDQFLNYRKYSSSGFLDNERIVLGTIKSLKPVYGIDLLIRAFGKLYEILLETQPHFANKISLRIVGEGDELQNLQALVGKLNLTGMVTFVGSVSHDQVSNELAKLDIYIALSRSESFGVAILEAGLNQCPVIVSNVGGLPELVVNHQTGIIVKKENVNEAALAMLHLIMNPKLISGYGLNAQKHVLEKYLWEKSVENMIHVYKTVMNSEH